MKSPNAPRPTDPLTMELAYSLAGIERNYISEGSGPGSRFEGKLLEDVQAEYVVRRMRQVCVPGRAEHRKCPLHYPGADAEMFGGSC